MHILLAINRKTKLNNIYNTIKKHKIPKNLTKDVQDLYNENDKTKIQKDLNK